jgi:hypothetical protein
VKRLVALLAASALVVIVVPAWAAKPTHPSHPSHPSHPAHPVKGKGQGKAKGHAKTKGGKGKGACKTLTVGYRASGTLTSATLTPGAKKYRFDGTLVADITRANHRAVKGSQTFTLTDTRVRFGKGVSSTAPAAGDRVTLHGRITLAKHGCTSSAPVITVRNVRISGA